MYPLLYTLQHVIIVNKQLTKIIVQVITNSRRFCVDKVGEVLDLDHTFSGVCVLAGEIYKHYLTLCPMQGEILNASVEVNTHPDEIATLWFW